MGWVPCRREWLSVEMQSRGSGVKPPFRLAPAPSTVILDGIPHNFLVLTSFGVNQLLILQPRDSSTRC